MIWLLFIVLEIARNYAIIEWWKKRPRYDVSGVIRFAAGAVFLLKRHPEFDPFGDPSTIWPALVYFVFQFSSFYLLFDLVLNLLRGKRGIIAARTRALTSTVEAGQDTTRGKLRPWWA